MPGEVWGIGAVKGEGHLAPPQTQSDICLALLSQRYGSSSPTGTRSILLSFRELRMTCAWIFAEQVRMQLASPCTCLQREKQHMFCC